MRTGTLLMTRFNRRRGFSFLEMVIAVAISTVLLLAVTGAFVSSSKAVQANDQFFRATQAARVTMTQMVGEIRRGDAVQVSKDGLQMDVIRAASARSADETYRRFTYDPAEKRMTLQIFYASALPSKVYTLASSVESASFGPPEMGYDSRNNFVVTRVPLKVTVRINNEQIILHGAAGPRRAAPTE
jgi:prepilin-type N-terminal cleavage/methylation domain-containing protein